MPIRAFMKPCIYVLSRYLTSGYLVSVYALIFRIMGASSFHQYMYGFTTVYPSASGPSLSRIIFDAPQKVPMNVHFIPVACTSG